MKSEYQIENDVNCLLETSNINEEEFCTKAGLSRRTLHYAYGGTCTINSSGKVSAYNIMAVSNLAVEEGKLSATSRPDYVPWVDESAFGIHRTEKKRIDISFAVISSTSVTTE